MARVLVVGLGAMGASLAAGLVTTHEVLGWDRRPDVVASATRRGWITAGVPSWATVAPTADLVVLATPVTVIQAELQTLAHLPVTDRTLVVDLGSTKTAIMAAAAPLLAKGVPFIGGHPMVGTDRSGLTAAQVTLYQGHPFFLTPEEVDPAMVTRLTQLLAPIGAQFIALTAADHDQMMATLSDLPHVVATTLLNTALTTFQTAPERLQWAAGGFRDTTRVGAADPDVWADILLTNKTATLQALTAFDQELHTMMTAIQAEDRSTIKGYFARGRHAREEDDSWA